MATLLFQLKSLYTNIPHILSETRYFSFTPSSLEIACFPGGSVVKNPPAYAGNVKDMSSIPGLERCPGEGNGNPLQYSYLGNPMDRGAWLVSPWGCKET